MFDTVVTIVGNALNTPEWRRLRSNQALVTKFKVAATSRRFDREHGCWVDGASLRVRVNCWRRLAENVAASVISGDPLIVTGRIYTRDWMGEDGQHRVSYEMDAVAVGHDLARGQSRFERNRSGNLRTTMVEDPTRDDRMGLEEETGSGHSGTDHSGTDHSEADHSEADHSEADQRGLGQNGLGQNGLGQNGLGQSGDGQSGQTGAGQSGVQPREVDLAGPDQPGRRLLEGTNEQVVRLV